MEVKKYIKYFLSALTFLVVLLVVWGIYVNVSGNKHLNERFARKYASLQGEKVRYREMQGVLRDMNVSIVAGWKSDVQSQVQGHITKIHVTAGQEVEEGQLLCEISNNDVLAQISSAEATVAEARANYINAQHQAERYTRLISKDAVSKADYDTAIANRDAAKARLDNSIAQRDYVMEQKNKLTIRSPHKCTVVSIYMKKGAYVTVGQSVMLLASYGDNEVSFSAPVDMVKLLGVYENPHKRAIMEVNPELLKVRSFPYVRQSEVAKGLPHNQFIVELVKIIPYDPVNVSQQRIVARIVSGSSLLEPTIYQRVKFIDTEKRRVLSIPLRAVNDYHNYNANYVYYVDKDSRLRKRTVNLGITDGEYIEVLEGLAEGETVAIDDMHALSEGMRVRIQENVEKIGGKDGSDTNIPKKGN